ncbi:hypothetical protein BYT27DRAFT_6366435 [Phlegmacium glaucopus]|nr:hypothetical protein BYT27DRAFT_6366435 [Phlegmacium glaucopus]
MPPQIGNIIEDTTACYFVEALGKEKALATGSFMNEVEACHIIHLARKLQEQEMSYRIITPYEGQRNYIERLMETEDDFIIISIVRTLHLGFLKDQRRTNVMLSRCKKGMFIVSTPHFLTEVAKDSLIGQFMKKVPNPTWLTMEDIQKENFLEEV